MRHLGIPLGLLTLAYGAWKIANGRAAHGIYLAVLGVITLLTWWATTRSARVKRWRQSNDAFRLEILAPGAAAGIVGTGAGGWLLASHASGRDAFAGVCLLLGGLGFLGMCAFAVWRWRGSNSPSA